MSRHAILLMAIVTRALCAATSVDAIGMTVSDLDRSIEFYSKILHFEKVADYEVAGDAYEHLPCV